MVAELAPRAATLPLLYEPDKPRPHGRAEHGWARRLKISGRIEVVELFRRRDDDVRGAQIQHAIARYVVVGVRRPALAANLNVSETQTQYILRGAAWGPYGKPVLRALRRLGVSPGKGARSGSGTRTQELLRAGRDAMRRSLAALDGAPLTTVERALLVADLRLLTIASDDDR